MEERLPKPSGNSPHAHLWEVANASHNWMESFARLVQTYFDNPNETVEMAVRMEAVAMINAVEAWRTNWS